MRSHVARLLASRLKAPAAPASPLPAVRVPVDAYRAKYGEAPDLYAAQGYDRRLSVFLRSSLRRSPRI